MSPVVHLHLHRRTTGVTRHVVDVVRGLPAEAFGFGLPQGMPTLSLGALWRRVRSGPLVLHAHRNLEPLVALLLRGVGRSVRVVFTRHSAGRPTMWTRWLAGGADARVVFTEGALAEFGLPATVVAHGVDATAFPPPENRARAWAALGVGGERGLGAVGRIRPEKGQGDLAEAWRSLAPQHPSWRAVLVGRVAPADARHAEQLLSTAPLVSLGERPDIPRVYQGLTVLVAPSRRESFGLVVLEAMAAGCCVVAARLDHGPALIEHGRTGFLYPPGDAQALAAALAPLLADPARAEAVGRAAAAEVRARHGLDQELAGLRSLYARGERSG
jgi:mannosyltransferase